MRIGIMLRALDEKGGIGVYTRNITHELLNADRNNHYFLYYRTAANLGSFGQFDNVTERVLKPSNKALWDQIGVPIACWRDNVDVVFHPKFTVPLLAPCRAVMVLHGAGWFMPKETNFFNRIDVQYIKMMMPRYLKKCAVAISVSQLTTDNFNRFLKLPPGKVKTVYFAPAKHFKRITDTDILDQIKKKYSLPERFILTLTKRGGGERKNIGGIFKAYAGYHEKTDRPYKLVVGGKDCHLLRGEYGIPEKGYGEDILFPGWIDQKDLPAVYSLATLFLYPSNLEAFPIPVTEAMACGTPIITSDANGLREIAGEAAVFVNPEKTDEITDALTGVLDNENYQKELAAKGLDRSKRFSWEKCARETLESLERSVN